MIDTFFIRGTYRFQPTFPDEIAGFEGAGIVESAGKDAAVPLGSLVAFFYRKAWAEYAIQPQPFHRLGPARCCATRRGRMDAAHRSKFLRLADPDPAGQRSVRIIALVRDLSQAPGLRALGADEVFDIEDTELSRRIQELTDGKGFNVALDAIGGSIGTKIFENIAPFGRFILYGSVKKESAQYFNGQIVYKDLTVKGFGIRAYLTQQTRTQRSAMIQELIETIGRPKFKLPIAKTYTLDQYQAALKENALSGRPGKVLFKLF